MTKFANRRTIALRCAILPLAGLIAAPQARAQILGLPVDDALVNLDARVTADTGNIQILNGQVADLDQAVGDLTGTVTTLTGQVTDTAQQVSVLTAQIDDQGIHIGVLDNQTAANGAAIDDLADQVATNTQSIATNTSAIADANARIDLNTAALDDLGQQVTANTQNIAANTSAIVAANARIDVNTAALDGLDQRVTTDEGHIAANTAAIAANSAADAVRDTRIAANTTAISGLDVRVTANTDAIAANNARDDAQDTRIDANRDAIAANNLHDDGQDTQIAANTAANARQDSELASQSQRIDATNAVAVAARADAADLRAGVEGGTIGLVRQPDPSGPVTVAAQTGGTTVSFSGTDGDRRLTGIADGVASNDAATVGQVAQSASDTLTAANNYTDNSISNIMQQTTINFEQYVQQNNVKLRKDMDSIGAGSAAIAGLPQAIIPGGGMMGAAIGGHGSQVAFAMGVSKAFEGDHAPVLKAGAAFDARRGEVTYNAGVGFHF